tara:strand:- start:4622 stop:6235 length:1614 start_codon:yes stop_codon:yes gene_type:complete
MKELKFIHITKTGGTSIEDEGFSAGIEWGRHHKEYGWWHEIFTNKEEGLRSKYDWFMVVRNPYERIISEFHCKWGGVGEKANFVGVQFFNEYLKREILNRGKITVNNHGSSYGDHYTEQHLYLDESVKTHVLKMENLTEEFDSLMSEYNIPLKLNRHNNSNRKVFEVHHMDAELIQLIQEVYKKDFETFGYSTEPPLKKESTFKFLLNTKKVKGLKEYGDDILFYDYRDSGSYILCHVFSGSNETRDYLTVYNNKEYPNKGLSSLKEDELKEKTLRVFLEKNGHLYKNKGEKVAFCFMSYGDIKHADLWEKFFNELEPDSYSIYIHPKEPSDVKSIFKNHIIEDRLETEWGDISLVRATNRLYEEALKDEANKVAVLLSDSCIPIHSPNIIKDELLSKKENILSSMGNMDEQSRYEQIKNKTTIKRHHFEKRSQWMSLTRETIKEILEHDMTSAFDDIFAPDEVYYPTMLNVLNIKWTERPITFVNWNDISLKGSSRLLPKTYEFISFGELKYMRDSGALFMRKMSSEAQIQIYNIY